MDLYSNAVGRKFGKSDNGSTSPTFYKCSNAARDGKMRTITPSGDVRTPGEYALDPTQP